MSSHEISSHWALFFEIGVDNFSCFKSDFSIWLVSNETCIPNTVFPISKPNFELSYFLRNATALFARSMSSNFDLCSKLDFVSRLFLVSYLCFTAKLDWVRVGCG